MHDRRTGVATGTRSAPISRLQADVLLLACAALWGVSFLFQKSAMDHIGPLTFTAARSLVAAIVLLPFVVFEHARAASPPSPGLIKASSVAAAVFVVAAYLQQSGISTATVTNTGFLTALYVVAVPFASYAITGRAIAPSMWLAVAISILGTALLSGGSQDGFGMGEALIAASAIFWAVHFVIVGRAAAYDRPALFTALQFIIVALVAAFGAALVEDVSLPSLQLASTEIIYVGVIATAATFLMFAVALRATSPTEAALIISTDTIFAAIAAWLVLGERLSIIGVLGATAILAAIVVVHGARSQGRDA